MRCSPSAASAGCVRRSAGRVGDDGVPPLLAVPGGHRRVVDGLAVVQTERRHVVVVERFLLVIPEDDADIGRRRADDVPKPGNRLLASVPPRLKLVVGALALVVLLGPELDQLGKGVRLALVPVLGLCAATVAVRPPMLGRHLQLRAVGRSNA